MVDFNKYLKNPRPAPDTQESPVPPNGKLRYPCDACREADCGVRKLCECKNPVCPCSSAPVPREETVCEELMDIFPSLPMCHLPAGHPGDHKCVHRGQETTFSRELDSDTCVPAPVPDTPGAIPPAKGEQQILVEAAWSKIISQERHLTTAVKLLKAESRIGVLEAELAKAKANIERRKDISMKTTAMYRRLDKHCAEMEDELVKLITAVEKPERWNIYDAVISARAKLAAHPEPEGL